MFSSRLTRYLFRLYAQCHILLQDSKSLSRHLGLRGEVVLINGAENSPHNHDSQHKAPIHVSLLLQWDYTDCLVSPPIKHFLSPAQILQTLQIIHRSMDIIHKYRPSILQFTTSPDTHSASHDAVISSIGTELHPSVFSRDTQLARGPLL